MPRSSGGLSSTRLFRDLLISGHLWLALIYLSLTYSHGSAWGAVGMCLAGSVLQCENVPYAKRLLRDSELAPNRSHQLFQRLSPPKIRLNKSRSSIFCSNLSFPSQSSPAAAFFLEIFHASPAKNMYGFKCLHHRFLQFVISAFFQGKIDFDTLSTDASPQWAKPPAFLQAATASWKAIASASSSS